MAIQSAAACIVCQNISGFNGALQCMESCPNQPIDVMAFYEKDCEIVSSQEVYYTLQEFQKYSREGTYIPMLSHFISSMYVSIALHPYK